MDNHGRQWIVNVFSWDNSAPTPCGRLAHFPRPAAGSPAGESPGTTKESRPAPTLLLAGRPAPRQGSRPAQKKGPVKTGPFVVRFAAADQGVGADGCKAGGVDELSPDGEAGVLSGVVEDGEAGVLSGVVDDGEEGAGVDGASVEPLPEGDADGSAEDGVALSCDGAAGGVAELSAGFSADGVVVGSAGGVAVLPSEGGVEVASPGCVTVVVSDGGVGEGADGSEAGGVAALSGVDDGADA